DIAPQVVNDPRLESVCVLTAHPRHCLERTCHAVIELLLYVIGNQRMSLAAAQGEQEVRLLEARQPLDYLNGSADQRNDVHGVALESLRRHCPHLVGKIDFAPSSARKFLMSSAGQ